MVRVLVAEDSPLVAELIRCVLVRDPEIQVVGVARDGKETIRMAGELKPDLITMDVLMPGMGGLEATKLIMAYSPLPILVLTSSLQQNGIDVGLKAIEFGAVEVMEKGRLEGDDTACFAAQRELIEKVKFLAKIKVLPHLLAKIEDKRAPRPQPVNPSPSGNHRAVGIVASTGGPVALLQIFAALPPFLPVPILVVQHIAPGFVKGLVSWLGESTALKIRMAQAGETLEAGNVYVSPSDIHMEISDDKKIVLKNGPLVDGARPSGTVLLKSIGRAYKTNCLGIILTGMGRDGADGLKTIYDEGGQTIAQDEPSSVIYGMPKEAVDMKIARQVLPLSQIADRIAAWAGC